MTRSMKRQVGALILICALLLLCASCTYSSEPPEATDGENAPVQSEPGVEITDGETSGAVRVPPTVPPEIQATWDSMDALNPTPSLSEEELALPTPELIDAIFTEENAYVFHAIYGVMLKLSSTYFYDDYGNAYPALSHDCYQQWRGFNGFLELETRPDAAKHLLERYKASDTDPAFGKFGSNYGGSFLMQCLEVVLSEEVYLGQLTETERAELYATVEGFHGTDRTEMPSGDQSYRFYPYDATENTVAEGEPIVIPSVSSGKPT